MIKKQTIQFLITLRENNHKDWFDAHKSDYKAAHQNFLDFTQVLIDSLSQIDGGIQGSLLEPKKCVMRIYRDVRFSKDKTPYKSNFFAFMNKGGKKSPTAGYYFNLEPGASFFGGGIYMPESAPMTDLQEKTDETFTDNLSNGKPVYWWYDYEDAVFRSHFEKEAGTRFFVKYARGNGNEIELFKKNSNVLMDAYSDLDKVLITKEDYDKFPQEAIFKK